MRCDRNDLAHVVVEVVDSANRLVPDAVITVKFRLKGAAELIAVANANPHNVDSFKQPQRETFHGRCLAVVHPTGSRGEVSLEATATGLAGGVLTLAVT
jgi:beta-galactosidase